MWLVAEGALALLVAFCPLALGTVHVWSTAVAAGLAVLAFGLAALACYRSGEPFELPFPTPLLAAAAVVTALQLVPLPPALLGVIAPETRDVLAFVLAPLGAWPSWRPLSLDPPATALALVRTLTLLLAFLAAVQVCRSRRARGRAVAALGLVGLLVALIGFGHALVGAQSLLGARLFRYDNSPFLSTLGSPNSLSSLLTLGATALLARVLGE
ncbi:MAG: polymerase, partial [Myxococcales bacterium]